jgi:hypothetical protein
MPSRHDKKNPRYLDETPRIGVVLPGKHLRRTYEKAPQSAAGLLVD